MWVFGVMFALFPSAVFAQFLTGYSAPVVQTIYEEEEATPLVDALEAMQQRSSQQEHGVLTGYHEKQVQQAPPTNLSFGRLTGYDVAPRFAQVSQNNHVEYAHEMPSYKTTLRDISADLPQLPDDTPEGAVNLQADSMSHDDSNQIITASGNVELIQDGRILKADEISYNLQKDIVVAFGNVVLHEVNGDVHYAQSVELRDEMKNGFAKSIRTFLTDGSRFTAAQGERIGGIRTIMSDASYTPCELCKEDPDKPPVWQIVGSEVTHDTEEKQIEYRHARFEVLGVPVAYVPYFSHPDGSVEQKSGLLTPYAGYKSSLGTFVENSYYWAIGKDRDATAGVVAYTDENPMVFGQYRQKWKNASLVLDASATSSKRTERKANDVDVLVEEELRGHVFAKGRWDIDDKWRAGLDVQASSDDQYLRQYDFSNNGVLESQAYAERFSGRDYFSARAISYQDVRIRENQDDQPDILPEVTLSLVGAPDSVPVVGGTWSVDGSYLGLRRGGDEQDYDRVGVDLGWDKRLVANFGLLTTARASVRGDFYNTRDRDVATASSGKSSESTDVRLFPQLHVQTSYPVARQFEKFQARVEPIVALTMAPNIDVNSGIPNEDSQDVQIDSSNIFEPNRFSGLDRVEDQSHVTYGLRTGIYGYGGSHADLFLGQSLRLDEDDNPFPVGSGFAKQESDYVGQVSAQYKDRYNLDYRFQLASNNFASQRHEVDGYADWNRFRLGARYLFAKALEGTDINQSREQLSANAQYYINEDWRLRSGGTQDLGSSNSGLRKAYVGLDHFSQCFSWSVTGQRNLTDNATGDSSTEILFRIGLKNIGEFVSSGLR